jgi:1,4-dihydroxy-2-naphthoate polyprenyltransferase
MNSSVVQRAPRPGSVGAWLLAARPKTLPVAFAPVALGASVAWYERGALHVPAAVAALLGALWLQIGTNFANDLFDAKKGADDEHRIGPQRAVQSGLLSARAMAIGTALAFAVAVLAGFYLVWHAGIAIVIIGIASVLSGIAYTGGPYPLGYNGLGDVFVFVFFGLVAVVGTTFVTADLVSPAGLLAGAVAGALATAVLVVNNVRDAEGDRRVGKRTLVARFGRRFGELEYLGLVLGSGVCVAALPLLRLAPWHVLIALLPLPLGLRLWRTLVVSRDGPTLNDTLAGTAKLMLATSLLLAVGFVVGAARP